VLQADFSFFQYYGSSVETKPGFITRVEETNASEGGDDNSDGTPIYANHYRFQYQGATLNHVSYSTGSHNTSGDRVQIELPEGKPELSRVTGMRRAKFGPGCLFIVIFPVVGICLIRWGMKRGIKSLRLLTHGQTAIGSLTRKERTGVEINDEPVYRFYFTFKAADGREYEMSDTSHVLTATPGEHQEKILYNPQWPAEGVMCDHLPGNVKLDLSDRVVEQGLPVALMLVPGLTVFGHGGYLLGLF
jgi:hypothetical protein